MLSQIDIFGSQILLRFKGEHTYNTRFGSMFTLLIISFIGFRLFFIIKDVFQRTSPQVIFNERQVDDPEVFEMTNSTFPIAFAMQHPTTYEAYIDESIYTIKAYQQSKRLVFNEATQVYDSVWDKAVQLNIKPCTAENFGNPVNAHYYLKLKYQNYYCFPADAVLKIKGDFNSDLYQQVRFVVSKCKTNCQPPDVLDKYLLKATFGMQVADVYIDPSEKDNPFKSYSRDMFWQTSTKLPKDVNIYLRNNYVLSDFGWILEDIRTQRFPSYSFYEDAIYPESYQTYFFQALFRFEKQKEGVYQRKYKNFNTIVSEIGGFTQSLLAIGILICTRVSQLHLNQEIINQAFNYEETSSDKQKQEEQELEAKLNPAKSIQQPAINQVNLADSNISQQKIQLYPAQQYLSAANSKQVQGNPSDNYQLSMNNLKRDQDSCSVSLQQDATLIHNNNNMNNPSQFQSFNKTGLKSQRDSPNNITQNQQQQAIKQLGEPRQSVKKDQKQILNFLLMDQFSEQEVGGEIIDGSSPQEEKIIKQKQKIQQQEQKLKENRFKQLMEKQTKSMKMSAWEYFKSIICPFGELKKRKQIINYSIEKLYYNLDIFNIVKRLIEVEKLKRLLLDSDQIKLFDYLPKPTINSDFVLKKDMKESLANKYEVDVLYQDNRTEIQKAKDAFLAYKTIASKSQHTLLDQKIIDLLDPNLVAVFEAQNRVQSQIQGLRQQQQQQYPKQDSPQQSPQQRYQEAPQDQIQIQEISLIKNEDKLLKQEVLSPRIQIQSQPILQLSSINGILEKSTQRSSDSTRKTNGHQPESKNEQDLEKSILSEIANEEAQQEPNQFFQNGKPSQTNFEDV